MVPLPGYRLRLGAGQSPQNPMTAALVAAAAVPSFAPAVGVTQTKEAIMTNDTTNKIAELNDLCRKAMGIAGRVVQTSGISALFSRSIADPREGGNLRCVHAGQ